MTRGKVRCTVVYSTVRVAEFLRQGQAAASTYATLLHVFDEGGMRVTRHLHHINPYLKTTGVTNLVIRGMARTGVFSNTQTWICYHELNAKTSTRWRVKPMFPLNGQTHREMLCKSQRT